MKYASFWVPDNALSDASGTFNINWSRGIKNDKADGIATLLKGLKLYCKLVVDHLTESMHVAGRHYSSKDK